MDATYNLNGGYKPTMKRFADLDGPDFFPTPAWATHALIDNEDFRGDIWEPACGDGAMSRVLETTGNKVISSDLHDRGYGEADHDFLDSWRRAPNIVTNPRVKMFQLHGEEYVGGDTNGVPIFAGAWSGGSGFYTEKGFTETFCNESGAELEAAIAAAGGKADQYADFGKAS